MWKSSASGSVLVITDSTKAETGVRVEEVEVFAFESHLDLIADGDARAPVHLATSLVARDKGRRCRDR